MLDGDEERLIFPSMALGSQAGGRKLGRQDTDKRKADKVIHNKFCMTRSLHKEMET